MALINWMARAVCAAVVSVAISVPPAQADIFAGDYTLTVEYDNDISDGVVLLQDVATPLAIARTSPTELSATITGQGGLVTIPLTQSGQLATAAGVPIAYAGWNLIEFAMVSDGVNKAFLMVGQDTGDPMDIDFVVSSWSEAAQPVTPADIAGPWEILAYSDSNLRNLGEGFEYEESPVEGTFVQIGVDRVHLTAAPDDGDPLSADMLVSGNIVSLIDPPVAHSHLLQFATDGNSTAGCSVGVETYDPTDVSVGIFLGHPTPEPASLSLLLLGALGLIRRSPRPRP